MNEENKLYSYEEDSIRREEIPYSSWNDFGSYLDETFKARKKVTGQEFISFEAYNKQRDYANREFEKDHSFRKWLWDIFLKNGRKFKVVFGENMSGTNWTNASKAYIYREKLIEHRVSVKCLDHTPSREILEFELISKESL